MQERSARRAGQRESGFAGAFAEAAFGRCGVGRSAMKVLLLGGTLLVTPMIGADGEVYAVGQGQINVGG